MPYIDFGQDSIWVPDEPAQAAPRMTIGGTAPAALPQGWVDASNYLAQTDNNFNAESGAINTNSPDVSLPVWARDGWAQSLGYTGGPTSKYVEGYGNPESGAYAPSSTADSDEWTKFVADKGLKLGAQDAGGNNAALQYFDPSGSAVGARQTNMVDASPDFMRDALGMAAAFAGGTYLSGLGGAGQAANGAQEAFRGSELAAQAAGAGGSVAGIGGLGYEGIPLPGGEGFGFANTGASQGGIASSIGANEGASQLAASLAANPVTQAQVTAAGLGPTGSLLGGAASGAAAGGYTTAAADSQAANAAMQAAGTPTGAAIAPAGVTLANAGGVMSTAPGLLGSLGGLGGQIGSSAQWLAANPMLAKLLITGAGGLLGAMGGSSSGSSSAGMAIGPAKQWQGGRTAAIQPNLKPTALPALRMGGNGAARYLKG